MENKVEFDKVEFAQKVGGHTAQKIYDNFEKSISYECDVETSALDYLKSMLTIKNLLNELSSGNKQTLMIKVRIVHIDENEITLDIINLKITKDIKGFWYENGDEHFNDSLDYKQIIREIKDYTKENDIVEISIKENKGKKKISYI